MADRLGVKLVELDELLTSSDIITIHAPKMPETIVLLDKKRLNQCKNGVIIINCARGGIVNEKELLDALSLNWLANDGVWFQAVEKKFGILDAKRCNDTCWTRFSPYEAYHIKTLLNLPKQGGLEALKAALQFRLYARINKQEILEEKSDSFVFRMVDCRVQASRRLKGLEDYPCKSIGIIEYRTFAGTIDSRIQTECLGCPPDPPQTEWYCAWRFSLR